MKFASIAFSTGIIALLFVLVLIIKTDVQTLLEQRGTLISEKETLQENIRVLQAEYAYLIRPERLTQFATHLELQPIAPEDMTVFTLEKSQ